MKTLIKFFNFFFIALLCRMLLISCTSEEPGVAPDPKDSVGTFSINADTISNHLKFYNATQIQGTLPTGPGGSSLQISFEDTLNLIDELKRPIKFLHVDPSENVSGIYVQVHGIFIGGTNATYYYDVPELLETATSDSVSIIMIGIDPDGLTASGGVLPAGAPFSFTITIVPYDTSGLPIAGIDRPVQISKPTTSDAIGNGGCGLVTQPGDYWDWQMSYIDDPSVTSEQYVFFNSPDKLWGLNGQDINGCCIDGKSSYDIICSGNTNAYRSLRFYTFFNYPDEIYKFIEDGTYAGLSDHVAAIPEPSKSDFCGTGPGVVRESFTRGFHEGNWTIEPLASPVNGDSLFLILQGTFSTGGSPAARPNGRIHFLDCDLLIVIQPDNEGGTNEFVKYYDYRDVSSPLWHPFI
jgi:hypothetical protein